MAINFLRYASAKSCFSVTGVLRLCAIVIISGLCWFVCPPGSKLCYCDDPPYPTQIPDYLQGSFDSAISTIDLIAYFDPEFLLDSIMAQFKADDGEFQYDNDQLALAYTYPNVIFDEVYYFFEENYSNLITLRSGAFFRGSTDTINAILLAGIMVHEMVHCCQSLTIPPDTIDNAQIEAYSRQLSFLNAVALYLGEFLSGDEMEDLDAERERISGELGL